MPPPRCENKVLSLKGIGDENDDCLRWANATRNKVNNRIKCFNCESCKAARLATYQTDQDKVRMYSLIAAVFLFIANLFVSMGGFE